MNKHQMNEQQLQAARMLAVRYCAYEEAKAIPSEARMPADWNSLWVWASALKNIQEEIGIELVRPESLDSQMKRADQYLKSYESQKRMMEQYIEA